MAYGEGEGASVPLAPGLAQCSEESVHRACAVFLTQRYPELAQPQFDAAAQDRLRAQLLQEAIARLMFGGVQSTSD